ncbi:antigen peptide transporter 1-like [Candoia aspera]|uniref:antigen peptide transporter 1-like n=1 Tax=Candoia aspera TaxID=51853 RepID=UPI002FD87291
MAVPYYAGQVTDLIVSKKEASAFKRALCLMSFFTVASAAAELLCDYLFHTVMNRFHACLQGSVLRSILRQEIAFFSGNGKGDITSHVSSDIDAMSEALSEQLSLLMWYLFRGLFLYAMMLWLSVPLTLFVTMTLPFILLLPKLSGTFYQNLATQVQQSLAKADEVAMETFQAISTVRSFANEDGAAQCYEEKLQETYQLNKREAVAYGIFTWIPEARNQMWLSQMVDLEEKLRALLWAPGRRWWCGLQGYTTSISARIMPDFVWHIKRCAPRVTGADHFGLIYEMFGAGVSAAYGQKSRECRQSSVC